MATKTPTPIREEQDEVALVVRRFEAAIDELPPEFRVANHDDYTLAGERLRDIKGRQKELKVEKDLILKPLNDGIARVRALFSMPEQRLSGLEANLKRGMLEFDQAQERARREAEARAREEQRLLQQKADEKADRLRARGKEEQAEAVLDNVPAIPVVIADKPKADGIARTTTYKAVVTDVVALAEWALEAGCFESYFKVDMPALNAAARSMKKAMRYPGVRVEEEMNLSARAS